MCKCTPSVRTPFCGALGCEWPKPEGTRSTPSRLDDERLTGEQLAALREMSEAVVVKGRLLRQLIDEIERRRAAEREDGRWVPWKPGDALPADGAYLIQSDSGTRYMFTVWGTVKNFPSYIIAYWSRPLPPPYVASSPDGEKGR